MLVEKVEIGFDLPSSSGNFFTLDSATKGKLDNTTYKLSGVIFYDVTSRVKQYTVRRGKSRQLENFNAGIATVTFDNRDRAFDPTFAASPYYGQIIPKREIRITTNTNRRYTGLVDDWNLDYSVSGESSASVSASDAFSRLANQTLSGGTATPQLSGARVTAVLDSSDVQWPADARSIDSGTVSLGADVQAADSSVLEYLQLVEATELGNFYVDKSGNLVFKDANSLIPRSGSVTVFSDDNSGIPYSTMQVVYGSELLHNQVVASSVSASGTVQADKLQSQADYGIYTYARSDLLMSTIGAVEDYATAVVRKYANPEYRFEALTIALHTLTEAQVSEVLALELGSLCQIVFTPNGVAPPISKYASVISIAESVDTVRHNVTLGFATVDYASFILDDVVFGRLDSGQLG